MMLANMRAQSSPMPGHFDPPSHRPVIYQSSPRYRSLCSLGGTLHCSMAVLARRKANDQAHGPRRISLRHCPA